MGNPEHVPAWHNVYFRNALSHTYYSLSLIRKWVTMLSHLNVDEKVQVGLAIPLTWHPIYDDGV